MMFIMIRAGTVPGEFYHILCRGNNKNIIFQDDEDRKRLLVTIFTSHSDFAIPDYYRLTKFVSTNSRLVLPDDMAFRVKESRFLKLNSFVFMDNHLHLAVEEKSKLGVARFTQRFLNSYTKYWNTRYDLKGHLFEGPYKIVHVESNEQLLYLSTYIHRNPRDLPGWKDREHMYPWSSCSDYLEGTDWQGLLDKKVILDQLENGLSYEELMMNSTAKE